MKLKVGLSGAVPGYEIILQQEGIPYEIIEINSEIDPDDYAVLMIPAIENFSQLFFMKNYVEKGGAVLSETHLFSELTKTVSKIKRVKYLVADPESIYREIGLIDIDSNIRVPRLKNNNFLDRNLQILYEKIGSGFLLNLPVNINSLLLNSDSGRKKFYHRRQELPSEIVSKISKNKLRNIVSLSLKFLFEKRNLPFIRKSHFPKDRKNIFIFRIDTDFCTKEQAVELHNLCRKFGIRATWFVDTNSPDLLDVYSSMTDQEVALHCDQHYVFPDYERNSENIRNGLDILKIHNISVKGFAAPFGDWNKNLGKVLIDENFSYSSEFALNYDDLPYYPFFNGKYSPVLQIPIHPISIGRLIRSHFNDREMVSYFKNIIDEKIIRREPIIFYYHPSRNKLNIIEQVFDIIKEINIKNLTFYEYSEFWKKRSRSKIDFALEHNKLTCYKTDDIRHEVNLHSKQAYINRQLFIELDSLVWNNITRIEIPEDIARMRTRNWRDYLYDLESRKGRRKHRNQAEICI